MRKNSGLSRTEPFYAAQLPLRAHLDADKLRELETEEHLILAKFDEEGGIIDQIDGMAFHIGMNNQIWKQFRADIANVPENYIVILHDHKESSLVLF